MSRLLKFSKKDYEFIEHRFPDYYKQLVARASQHGDEVWISIKDQSDYDRLLTAIALEIGDAATPDGEMSKDGLRLEAAWDYADREGVPFGEK